MASYELGPQAIKQIQEVVRAYMNRVTVVKPDRARTAAGGGKCKPQNCKLQITILGSPTGGTFDFELSVNGVEEALTIAYNASAAAVTTAIESHSQINVGDVTVTGGNLPNVTINIEFVETYAQTDIGIPFSDWSSLTGGSGVGVITSKTQIGHPKSA